MKLFIIILFVTIYLFSITPVMGAKCTAEKPNKAPDLFQIDVKKTSAKLYFTPVNNAVTRYTIVYGLERGREDFGVSFPFGKYEGVIDYTVNDLNQNTKYYFRVRADNGCRQGFWSDTMSVQTNWDFKTYTRVKPSSSLTENLPLSTFTPVISLIPENPTSVPSPTIFVKKDIKRFNFFDFFSNFFKKIQASLQK